MCFSASASFGAAALIGSAGVIGLRKATTKPTRSFALIPIFFALQQFSEGLLWISLAESSGLSSSLTVFGTYGFLFFAWLIWPFYIPYSLRLMEDDQGKKKILTGMLYLGSALSVLLAIVLMNFTVTPSISNFHISYALELNYGFSWLMALWYLVPTVFSCFISTVKKMSLFAVINLTSYVLSKIYFQEHVISVWCFFAAVTSVMVLLIVYERENASEQLFGWWKKLRTNQ